MPRKKPRAPHRPRSPQDSVFSRWFDASTLSAEELADLCGVTVATVYNWRNGNFLPGRRAAAAIAEVSRGKVPASSWDDPKGGGR